MAGSFETLAGPTYISSHYADNILSDVRPIKLKLEALRSINVLLDEFLYNILSAAGSLSTDHLKAGLNKLLPTPLGKEAVLEAEVELKSYWERNTPDAEATKQDFDLQWSFELLRLKCEGYTTMNDTDEDPDALKRVNDRNGVVGSLPYPHANLLAPASLYLTAIIEHICEHILSNVSRVAARDSGRTVATVLDLFVGLCEDEGVYSMFKTMKVYEQIESLSTMQHPRRSKSLSKGSLNGRTTPAARGVSPHVQQESSDGPTLSRLRVSSESARPNLATTLAQQPASNGRASSEKSRVKLFGRSSSDHERSEISDPRLQSDDTKSGNSFEIMDEAAVQEFDELMKSSGTMKVSLTPDRLKSMEVYRQEKKRHKVPEVESTQVVSPPPEFTRAGSGRRARHVDSILEAEEPTTTTDPSPLPSPSPPSQAAPAPAPQNAMMAPRTRLASMSTAPSAPSVPPAPRTRSVTISTPLSKKRSNAQIRQPPPPLPPNMPTFPPRRTGVANENFPVMQNGRPPRLRKLGQRRESMDLDEIMGMDDDSEFGTEPPTPRSRRTLRDGSKPYVSSSARDLIDFLDEGPPEEEEEPLRPPKMSMLANVSMVSLESSKSRTGRLHRMMSRLTLGGSNEKLNRNGSITDDGRSQKSRRSPSTASFTSTPPSAYLPNNMIGKQMPSVIVATPPPPLSSLASMGSSTSTDTSYTAVNGNGGSLGSASGMGAVNGMSPVRSPSYTGSMSSASDSVFGSSPRPAHRHVSVTRKAAPTWDGDEKTEQVINIMPSSPSSPTMKAERRRSKSSSPLDAFPPVPDTISIDGRILPNGHVEVITEIRARRESRTPSPAVSNSSEGSERRSSMIRRSSVQTETPAVPALPSNGRPVSTPSPIVAPVPQVASSSTPAPVVEEAAPRVSDDETILEPDRDNRASYQGSVIHITAPIPAARALSPPAPAPAPAPPPTPQTVTAEVQTDDIVEEPVVPEQLSDIQEQDEAVQVEEKIELPGPAFTAYDAQDLRRLLTVATTADECRLLVDMFLARSGFPVGKAVSDAAGGLAPDVDATASALEDYNDSLERSLVSAMLGDEDEENEEFSGPPSSFDGGSLLTYA